MEQCNLTELWNAAIGSAVTAKVTFGLIGLACIWMGYQLFAQGVYKGGADIRAGTGNNTKSEGYSFSMSRGGPGLVFTLFGACVVLYSIAHESNTSLEREKSLPIEQVISKLHLETDKLRADAHQLQEQDKEMTEHFKMTHSFMMAKGSEEEERRFKEWMQEENRKEIERADEYRQRIDNLNNRISALNDIRSLLTADATQ